MAQNTIKVADLAKVQDIEFVTRFQTNIDRLVQAIGIAEPVKMQAGTVLKLYRTSGTLENGNVAEAETIPLSKYSRTGQAIDELTWKKWAKETSLEAISKRGYGEAVDKTDEEMIRDIQMGILDGFFSVLEAGTGTAQGGTLQAALAYTRAELRKKFKNTTFTPIYFVSTDDMADYLATHEITLQTAFGFNYIQNFLSLGTVIEDPDLTPGQVIGTATENLNLYYADPAGVEGLTYYTDETGLVGIQHAPEYSNATYKTYGVSALRLFPEYADRIVKATIGSGSNAESGGAEG